MVTKDDRFAFVTNFGDGTVSSYEITARRGLELADPVACSTGRGQKGLRDEVITGDGRYLYAIDPGAQTLVGGPWAKAASSRGPGNSAGCPPQLPSWRPADRPNRLRER